MAIGKTPQNQLDALPLQDADSAAAGGEIQIVGGVINRFFSSSVLQITGVAMTTFTGEQALVTPYLDVRGCNQFVLTLSTVNNVSGRAALPAIFVFIQTRLGASDTPPVYYANNGGAGTRDEADNSIQLVTTTGHAFAITAAAGEVQRHTWAWNQAAVNNGGLGATAGGAGWIGTDSRLIITTQTVGMSTNNLFSATLWASS